MAGVAALLAEVTEAAEDGVDLDLPRESNVFVPAVPFFFSLVELP